MEKGTYEGVGHCTHTMLDKINSFRFVVTDEKFYQFEDDLHCCWYHDSLVIIVIWIKVHVAILKLTHYIALKISQT